MGMNWRKQPIPSNYNIVTQLPVRQLLLCKRSSCPSYNKLKKSFEYEWSWVCEDKHSLNSANLYGQKNMQARTWLSKLLTMLIISAMTWPPNVRNRLWGREQPAGNYFPYSCWKDTTIWWNDQILIDGNLYSFVHLLRPCIVSIDQNR